MSTITAVIPARNEEQTIQRCIRSAAWCDKVQVLWMGNDKTGELARELGAEVIEMNSSNIDDFVGVQKNINWAIDNATTDWILRIDADEEITEELKKEIQLLITNHKLPITNVVAFGIPRNQYFWGGFLKGGDWAYDRLIRLFQPSACRYDPIVSIHEQFKVNGPIGYLQHKLNHYSHPTLDVAVKKFNVYTSAEVHDMKESYGKALWNMFFLPPYIFLRWMIWHHGYKDGLRGVVAGAFRAWYEFMKYAKYIEYKFKNN
jgi:glycosyltransferase involved in cell wall biosynthesis